MEQSFCHGILCNIRFRHTFLAPASHRPALAMLVGRLVSRIKLPSISGWLIIGMLFGPHALGLMPQPVLGSVWYKTVVMWMQCAFGLMLRTELVWKELKSCGKGLIVTTLPQSLGTFFFVTLVFAIVIAAKKGFVLAKEIERV